MKTAVVILNWNGKQILEQFMGSIVKHSHFPDVKLYLIDNASTDESVAFIQSNFPQITIIQLEKNYGFAEGYNRGLKQIDADVYVLLNSDVEVTENWLPPLLDTLDNDITIGACMPKVKSFKQRDTFEYAGAAGGFMDKFGYTFCRGRIFEYCEQDSGQYDTPGEIFWASGACFVVRAELFHRAGVFDSDFFAHMEEIDLCWRMKNMGYKIVYQPKSEVFHVGGATLNTESPRKLYLNHRNNLFMLYKNLPPKKKSVIFIRIWLDCIVLLKYLISLQPEKAKMVGKAIIDFFTSRNLLNQKREKCANIAKPAWHKEIYEKSIVKDYFIFKKKKFSALDFNLKNK